MDAPHEEILRRVVADRLARRREKRNRTDKNETANYHPILRMADKTDSFGAAGVEFLISKLCGV